MACIVVRGGGAAGLGDTLTRLAPRLRGRAVVLVRVTQPTPVDAGLVHELVDLLLERGCVEVAVGASLSVGDRDRGHHSVHELARRAGLAGRTGRGRRYDLVDLLDEVVAAPVPATSVLDRRPVSTRWARADTRVVVARAVTDLVDGYAASLATLLGAARDVPQAEPADVVTDLLEHLAPTVVVVDALQASVGTDGGRVLDVVDSASILVATDAVTADGATAALLGLDRGASRLVKRAVDRLGSPAGRIEGALTAVDGARAAHPLARAAARALAAEPRLERVLGAAIGGPDEGAEPVDEVLATLRTVLAPLVTAAVDATGGFALASLLSACGSMAQAANAWAVGAAKDSVDRREVPLGFEPAAHEAAYATLATFFGPFDDLVADLAPNVDGMRWRLVDGATVFEVTRTIPADFDDFVARVDVAAGISLMADYLGGRRVTVPGATDQSATWQAERNLYLPQPNYLAAWGGQPIDVCKVELVERSRDHHRLTWRTVYSPNGSAELDDGTLTFSRALGGTVATVRGRQLFTLPWAWDGADLGLVPSVREPLLEEAYRRFFTTTFDNLEACFEGRGFRIGRTPDPDEPLLTRSLDLVLGAVRHWLGEQADLGGGREAVAAHVDSRGFRHVRGPR